MRLRAALVLAVLTQSTATARGESASPAISDVAVSPPFFNPSIGQNAALTYRIDKPARVTLSILDRDGYVIRKLAPVQQPAGAATLNWDGKDQTGSVVPNEAYSVNLVAEGPAGQSEYAPSRHFVSQLSDPPRSYAMVSGVLRYELGSPSRVHIQAGEAVLVGDPKEGKRDGPVMKTIVDREPRSGGVVVETWDGYDESRTVHIASLKNFAISILGESLPPATIIAVGNRAESFRHYAARARAGKTPLYPPSMRGREMPVMPGMKHDGLNALEDFSPELTVTLAGKKDEQGRVEVGSGQITLKVQMPPNEAGLFVRPEAGLDIFVDEKRVSHKKGAQNPTSISIPASAIAGGEHRVTVNWISTHGPMSAQVVRVIREEPKKEAAT